MPRILYQFYNGERKDRALFFSSIEIGVWCAIGFNVQAVTLQFTTASKNAFITALSVIFIPLFEAMSIFLKSTQNNDIVEADQKLIPPSICFSLTPSALALLGVGILEMGGLEPPKSVDAIVCIVPLAFALNFFRSEHLSKKYPHELFFITGVILTTTCFISFFLAFMTSGFPDDSVTLIALIDILTNWKVGLPLLYTGIITTAITSYVEQRAIKILSSADIAVIYTLEPLFATLFSNILLREDFGLNIFFGAIFIILSCLWKPIIYPLILAQQATRI